VKIVTADEMRRLDREATEVYGLSVIVLMEQAGMGVVREMERRYGDLSGATVVVLAGKGHNGGDGIVAARHLMQRGARVRAILAPAAADVRGEAARQLDIFNKIGGVVVEASVSGRDAVRAALAEADYVIDALFGTGLSAELTGIAAALVDDTNAAGRPVIAVDIPSGIHADTGAMMGAAVRAEMTVTFALPKRGHFLSPGADHTGLLRVIDIGIPATAVARAAVPVSLFTQARAEAALPPRPRDGHKGTFGHVVAIAGSRGKNGAAWLLSKAALRAGAGLVTLAGPRTILEQGDARPAEVMTLPLPETPRGTLAIGALEPLLAGCQPASAVAIGPGLSTDPETQSLIRDLLTRLVVPVVVDADALNALVGHLDLLTKAQAPIVITPHPGEMARLQGSTPRDIQQRRVDAALDVARTHRVVAVLKGAHTVVATPDGLATLNPTGNPGMATAGSGDALTGVIAALLAQGVAPSEAARLGVYLHGTAGDLAAADSGERGLIAGDLIERLPSAMRDLTASLPASLSTSIVPARSHP